MQSKQVFFITFLRALAACLITNAHYTGIYPTDIIANGGLIGNVLFFAVSGYCLYNIKHDCSVAGFFKWYGKRIWRVYPPVIIMTVVFMACGAYKLSDFSLTWWYVYPTYYHFVASIIILYIPFFFVMKIECLRNRIIPVMALIGAAWLIFYIFFYDKSYYHIDTVREPVIRFLFIECMLLGAWFRQNDDKMIKWRNSFKPVYSVITIILFFTYFASKLLFAHRASISNLQFLNQIAIFALLSFLFITFCSMDERLEHLPEWVKAIIRFVSNMTLEIYVVQYVLIDAIRKIGLAFPLNWFALTGSILLTAFALHKICEFIYRTVDRLVKTRGGNH